MNFSPPRTSLAIDTIEKAAPVGRRAIRRNSTVEPFEEAPAFVAMVEGESHRFTFASAAYLKLVGLHKVVGLTVAEVFPELRDQGVQAVLDGVFKTGRRHVALQTPMGFYTGDGSERREHCLTFVYEPIRNDDGTMSGILIDGHAVTSQFTAEGNVYRIPSSPIHVDHFSAIGTTLAHELNQSLTAISNYLSASRLLLGLGGDVSVLSTALTAAFENTRKAANIIRSAPSFADCAEIVQEQFALNEAIWDIISNDQFVTGDAIQIQQVVLNLMRNDCEATAAGQKQVTISSNVMAGMARVCVDDDGSGIPFPQLETVFDAFHDTRVEGAGIGLTISRTIIEANGGAVSAENKPGRGARFCFTLPIAA